MRVVGTLIHTVSNIHNQNNKKENQMLGGRVVREGSHKPWSQIAAVAKVLESGT